MSLFRRRHDDRDVTWPIVAISADDRCVRVVPDAASLPEFVRAEATAWLSERRDPPGVLDLFDSAGHPLAPRVGPGWMVFDVHVADDAEESDQVLKRMVAAMEQAERCAPEAGPGPRPDPQNPSIAQFAQAIQAFEREHAGDDLGARHRGGPMHNACHKAGFC